ncbi:MAG: DUF721 domain-containing protein [Acidobacteria bacterium]|nr:DUF721 domain-containing protein [Acidobacteriota bacterium]
MDVLTKLIPFLIKQSNNNEEFCEKASFIAWRSSVGHPLVKVTLPKRLVKKTLVVAVIDETWKKELEKFSPQLLFQINTILGTPLVTGFEFYVDAREINAKLFSEKTEPMKNIKIDPLLLESSEKITDDSLRKQFLTTASKALAAQELKNQQQQAKDSKMGF